MEIPLFQDDEQLRFERIVFYPYPSLDKIWARCWVSAVEDASPNIEFRVLNPDGSENCSVFMMAQSEQRGETTLHLRKPVPGATYHVVAELTTGMADNLSLVDQREFDLVLEFRNPEALEPGFGVGVDWDELQRNAGEQ